MNQKEIQKLKSSLELAKSEGGNLVFMNQTFKTVEIVNSVDEFMKGEIKDYRLVLPIKL